MIFFVIVGFDGVMGVLSIVYFESIVVVDIERRKDLVMMEVFKGKDG